jgi:SAM-dependent methyltransferase
MPSKLVASLLERWYGHQPNGTIEFRNLVTGRLRPDHWVLDLGCGRGREETDFRTKCAFVAGCDYSNSVTKNRFISAGVKGDAYILPFKSGVFDVVVMDFVMEHLEYPNRCVSEVARVLKPGGCLIFRTPNLCHYVAIIARLTPQSFHRVIVRKLAGIDEVHAFDTFYRLNTRHDVMEVFAQADLQPREIRMVEKEPYYLTFALPAFLFGCLYERLVNRFEPLAAIRSNIFGYFTKSLKSLNDDQERLKAHEVQSSVTHPLSISHDQSRTATNLNT